MLQLAALVVWRQTSGCRARNQPAYSKELQKVRVNIRSLEGYLGGKERQKDLELS